jgi:hypothetical protein
VKNKHGSIVHAKMEVHEKGCQLAGLREVGDAAAVAACPCIKARLLTLLMATLAVRGSAADDDEQAGAEPAAAEGFTNQQVCMVFLCGILVGMMTMAFFFGPEDPEAEVAAEPEAELAEEPAADEAEAEPSAPSPESDGDSERMMNSFMLKEAVMEYDGRVRATIAHLCEKRNFKGARDRRRGCKLCVLVYPVGGEKLFISSCGNCYHADEHCAGLRKAVTARACFACRCE